jgi:hypothetical protein
MKINNMKKLILIVLFMFSLFAQDNIDVIYSSDDYCSVKIVQEGLSYMMLDSVNYIILKNGKYYFSNKNKCFSIISASNNNLLFDN